MLIGTYINNFLKYKLIKHSNQRHQLAEWIQKQDPYICCLQDMLFRPRDTYRPKMRGSERIFHANGNQKKSRAVILIIRQNRP